MDKISRSTEEEIEQALRALDVGTKREYLQALEIVPHLVDRESPKIAFWRTENQDPSRAARRLALYWKYRKETFGDRWLLPMMQTGTGALSSEVIHLLRSGFFVLLPTATTANLHAPLLIVNMTKRPATLGMAVNGCFIYFGTVCTDEAFQTVGATVLTIVSANVKASTEFYRSSYELVANALPLKFTKLHTIPAYEEGAEGKEKLLDYLVYHTSKMVEHNSGGRSNPDMVQPRALGAAAILQECTSRGLHREYLPHTVGGDLNDQDMLHEFIRRRLSVEDILGPSGMDRPVLSELRAKRHACHLLLERQRRHSGTRTLRRLTNSPLVVEEIEANNPSSDEEDLQLLRTAARAVTPGDEDQDRDRQKELNALYSRRLYHKRKLAIKMLEEQTEALCERNKKVRQDNERLFGLLAQASHIVSSLSWGNEHLIQPRQQHIAQITAYPMQEQQQQQQQNMAWSPTPYPPVMTPDDTYTLAATPAPRAAFAFFTNDLAPANAATDLDCCLPPSDQDMLSDNDQDVLFPADMQMWD